MGIIWFIYCYMFLNLCSTKFVIHWSLLANSFDYFYSIYFNYCIILYAVLSLWYVFSFETVNQEKIFQKTNNTLIKFLTIINIFLLNTMLRDVFIFITHLSFKFFQTIWYFFSNIKAVLIVFYNKNLAPDVWKPIIKKTSYYEYYRSSKLKYDEIRFIKNNEDLNKE